MKQERSIDALGDDASLQFDRRMNRIALLAVSLRQPGLTPVG